MRALFLIGLAACARPRATPPPIDPTPAPAPGPAAPTVAWFGAWNDDGTFERRNQIEKVEGRSYGWRIKTHCTGPLRFREVMRLPAPGEWTFTPEELPGTTVSDDQTTTTTIDYVACKQGWVEHEWTVAEGDPVGTYVITVELEGYATQTFRPRFIGQ